MGRRTETMMRMKLIDDVPFVFFPGAIIAHRLDPSRPGQTMCGRDVDPWSVEFSRSPGELCDQCAAANQRLQAERN